jgi:RNA polymerase sigma-70 factor (ECF subfamily)
LQKDADMTAISLARTAELTSRRRAGRHNQETRFNGLIAAYMDDLYRYAYWLSGNPSVADDLVQETLVRAWKAMDKLQDEKAVKGWLLTILRRENARRFERKRPVESEVPTEEVAADRKDYDTSTEAFVLRRALESLPEEYREPLLLQVIHGYSQKEIAAHLNISVAGAGTRLFRAREKLRRLLG